MTRKKDEDVLEEENPVDEFEEAIDETIDDAGDENPEPKPEEDDNELEKEAGGEISSEAMKMTADVPVQVVVVLGKKTISMKDLIGMRMGQVIDLVRPANEIVDLVAGGKLIAKGELVDIDGKMGIRIVKMTR